MNAEMPVMIKMPLAIYRGFIGICLLESREYEILRNSGIAHVPANLREGNVAELFCGVDDATRLLTLARSFYPAASPCIEEGMRLAGT